MLALLLAQANEVVPAERLIDGVWDGILPETAANILQGYVSQLRKLLGKDTIVTRGRGYVVLVADGALDLHRFERHAADGMSERGAGRAADGSGGSRRPWRSGVVRRSRIWPTSRRFGRSLPASTSCA